MDDALPQPVNTASATRTRGVRVRFLFGLALVCTFLVYVVQRFGYETFAMGRDVRLLPIVVIVGIGLILAFFRGGFTWRGRLQFLGILATAGLLTTLLIRRIQFDGAMIPRQVEWIWEPPHEPRFNVTPSSGDPMKLLGSWTATPTDCPEFRGLKRDGVIPGPPLAREWRTKPPKRLWGPVAVGGGYGSIAAVGDHLVTLEQRLDREAVVCYRRDTGQEIWTFSYPANFIAVDAQGGPGPRSTPTVVGDRIFSFGATGVLVRLDGHGKLVWSVDVLDDVKADNLPWGMAGSPLVVDDLVIVNAGVKNEKDAIGGVVAYDVETGKRRWTASNPQPAGYSSPELVTLGGVMQVLIFDGRGFAGLDPKTGKQLWREPWTTNQGIHVAQPILCGDDRVFISSGYMVGGGLFHIGKVKDQWTVERLWRDRRSMQCKFTSPVVHDGRLYGISDVDLVCVDVKTGKRLWKGPEVGYGQVLLRGDLLLAVTETGAVIMAAANPTRYEELGRFEAFKEKTWNTPTLAGDRLYLRNHRQMACFQLPTAPPDLAARP